MKSKNRYDIDLLDNSEYIARICSDRKVLAITIIVTNDCNFRCSYCFEQKKSHKVLSFENAKKFIDDLLDEKSQLYKLYLESEKKCLQVEFMGGEPLLEIELISDICDYLMKKLITTRSELLYNLKIAMPTNGSLYFEPKVQDFINKYGEFLTMTISLDGTKELHDKCRRTTDGKPTYDISYKAALAVLNSKHSTGTKLTIAPANVEYVYDGFVNLIQMGYTYIHGNVVFEEGWTEKHAQIYYQQLKKLADYCLENDIIGKRQITIFNEDNFSKSTEKVNWCGGDGVMVGIDPSGNFIPCVRYTECSLNGEQEEYSLGTINTGFCSTDEELKRLEVLKGLTFNSQSPQKCIDCQISKGCAWCSAYNYQKYGTPNKRATFICQMHQAEALANVYFWNNFYQLHDEDNIFQMHCPKEWALKIIDEDEYNMLYQLSKNKNNS